MGGKAIRSLFLCFVLVVLFAPGAQARERILSFVSDVTIETDASLTVTEKITVKAEGSQIKRGIIREFPTSYKDNHGNRFRTTFDIVSVHRGSRPEPYHTERRSNGVALYIGNADTLLSPGKYTYEITYKTTRQTGYFDGFDELYWNVTGNGWRLPIDSVTYNLHLPGQARALKVAAYTGFQGDNGQDFIIQNETEGLVSIQTTRPFAAKEGLTVGVSFPTGLVHKPTVTEQSRSFFRDNAGVFLALIGLLGILGYYLYFWDLKGRDPEGGAIIPRFKPPEGFSPAAARYVHRMAYDRVAFSSAIINMAVKGYLKIVEDKKVFTLEKTGEAEETLTSGEQRIASRLFGSFPSIEMKNKNHEYISDAIRSFEGGLQAEFKSQHFATNHSYFYFGAGLTALIMVAAAVLNAGVANPAVTIAVQGLIALIAGVTAMAILKWTTHRDASAVGLNGMNLKSFFKASRYIFIALVILPQFAVGAFMSQKIGVALPVIAVALGIANGVFFYLLKAPTRLGRQVQDEIEGFRLYLATAEQPRLEALNPPEKTPELFEKFLPFALALGVDNEWSEQFTDVLAAASVGGQSYHPLWYSGRRWRAGHMSSFSSDLSSSFSSAIASSAQAPGSSSGSGGGGFSGGGGGGGGGGGW